MSSHSFLKCSEFRLQQLPSSTVKSFNLQPNQIMQCSRQAIQLNYLITYLLSQHLLLGSFNILVLHKQVKRDALQIWCGVDGEALSGREELDIRLVPARLSLSGHSWSWNSRTLF